MVVNGKKIADSILNSISRKIKKSKKRISLGIVVIGKDPATESFVKQKQRSALKAGILVKIYFISENSSAQKVKITVRAVARKHTGIIVQLPLPEKLKKYTQEILDGIPSKKDVDVLSTTAWADFLTKGRPMPPIVQALDAIFKTHHVKVKRKNAVVVGYGQLVGKPASFWLALKGAHVKIIDIGTKNKKAFLKNADVIISGVGKSKIIRASDVKKGVVVIDVGTSKVQGKLKGDVDLDVIKKARVFSTAPGGIGPIVVAMVLKNTLEFSLD